MSGYLGGGACKGYHELASERGRGWVCGVGLCEGALSGLPKVGLCEGYMRVSLEG